MKRENVPQSDDLLYRNYLIDVRETFTYSPPGEFGPPPLSKNQIRQQTLNELKGKFKQDFSTNNNEIIGANEISIEVVMKVLTDDLGFNPANIPDQGTLNDRAYLDNLIALSNQTPETLMAAYHIDLTRSDLEKTTRVRENILTLQSHLRDDKFESHYNPFFLYKDEWRLRFKTPFFPENHYALKKGLFATSEDRNRALNLVAAIEKHGGYNADLRTGGFVKRMKILFINPKSNLDYHLTEGHRQFFAEEYSLAMDHYNKATDNIRDLVAEIQIKVWILPIDGSKYLECSWTPGLGKAEDFVADLDPATAFIPGSADATPGTHLFFGSDPSWGGNYWFTYKTLDGKTHKGRWEDGKEQGWWDPIDMRSWDPVKLNIPKKTIPPKFPFTAALFDRLKWRYSQRANMKVNSVEGLEDLEERNLSTVKFPSEDFLVSARYEELRDELLKLHDDLISLVPHVMFCLLPICQADIASAIGDFPNSAKDYAQVAKEQLLRGSLTKDPPFGPSEAKGDLPWSWTKDLEMGSLTYGQDYPYLNKDCELPFLLLRLGKLYLTWADELYRSDQETEVYRARELYKAVLQQYGIVPLPGAELAPLPVIVSIRPATVYDFGKINVKGLT